MGDHRAKRVNLADLRAKVETATTREDDLDIPELGGTLRFRGLTRDEQYKVQAFSTDRQGKLDGRKLENWTVIYGSVDPHFTQKDLDVLDGLPPGVVARMANYIAELSGYGGGVDKAVAEAEESFQGES